MACSTNRHFSQRALARVCAEPRPKSLGASGVDAMLSLVRFGLPTQCLLVWLLSLAYIMTVPFTKVEESFSLQAIHDYLFVGKVPLISHWTHDANASQSQWDHESFPGVVHRTFLSPFVVHLLVKPFQLLNLFEEKFAYQILARIALSTLFTYTYYCYIEAIVKSHSALVGKLVTLITLSQFHFIFYASRTLPNTFALILVMLIYSAWFTRKWHKLICLVAFTVLIIRFETILLFAWILLYELAFTRQLKLLQVLIIGIPSGIICLAVTILFDSFMWNKWVWPEGDGILFNIIHNQSHQWGTQPFLWYFYSVIPRLLLFSSIFAVSPTFWRNKYSFVVTAFVLVYSILPHKELRFIVYIVPLLNLCASNAIVRLLRDLSATRVEDLPFVHRLIRWILKWSPLSISKLIALHLVLNLISSLFMLYISSANYPGGESLRAVNNAIKNDAQNANQAAVYVSNLAAQTGFSRFLQLEDVYYNKEANFVAEKFASYTVIYLVLEVGDERLYFDKATQSLSDQSAYQLNAGITSSYQCSLLRNITAFDRIDLKLLRVNFRTFLNIYKCNKTQATSNI